MVSTGQKLSLRQHPVISHILALVAGGLLAPVALGVLGNLATDSIKSHFVPAEYHYTSSAPACERGSSGWQLVQAQADCSSGALKLSVAASPATGEAIFVDQHQAFPHSYRVSVKLSEISPDACAGVLVRGNLAAGNGYAFLICPGRGAAQISYYDAGAKLPNILNASQLRQSLQNTYALVISVQGDRFDMFINGKLQDAIEAVDGDTTASTQDIALLVSPKDSATFANLAITQL